MRSNPKKTEEAVDTYHNGNISDFKAWLKKSSKLDILHAIEYHQQYGPRHGFIACMRNYLEEM